MTKKLEEMSAGTLTYIHTQTQVDTLTQLHLLTHPHNNTRTHSNTGAHTFPHAHSDCSLLSQTSFHMNKTAVTRLLTRLKRIPVFRSESGPSLHRWGAAACLSPAEVQDVRVNLQDKVFLLLQF